MKLCSDDIQHSFGLFMSHNLQLGKPFYMVPVCATRWLPAVSPVEKMKGGFMMLSQAWVSWQVKIICGPRTDLEQIIVPDWTERCSGFSETCWSCWRELQICLPSVGAEHGTLWFQFCVSEAGSGWLLGSRECIATYWSHQNDLQQDDLEAVQQPYRWVRAHA